MSETMQARGFRHYGSADVLEQLTLPRPTLKPDSVLIRVAAAGVNPADWRIRAGQFRLLMRSALPFVPGSDVAGVVAEVGAAVGRVQPGDAVYAMTPSTSGGGYAQYVAVAEQAVALMPANVSFAQAAATPLAALTALQALRDKAALKAGHHVLINGASGGVGTFALQIAKAMGAKVTAVASGANRELVLGLGADTFIDYTSEEISAGPQRFDVVFDAMNTFAWRKAGRVLRRDGTFVSVNPALGLPVFRWLARLGGWNLAAVVVQPRGADLETLNRWLASGSVRPVIERCYSLDEAAQAQLHSETGRVRGKLVLVVDPQLPPGQQRSSESSGG